MTRFLLFSDRAKHMGSAPWTVLAIGITAALSTWIIRLALVPWINDLAPFALLFVGIAVAAMLAGWRSGLVALIIGEPLIWWSILEPRWSLGLKGHEGATTLVFGVITHSILLGAIALYQREVRLAWAARDDLDRRRDSLVRELDHRVKNTLTIVQSIAKQTFLPGRGMGAIQSFEGRLMNLTAAHDLLTENSWQVTPIGEVVERALSPFFQETAFIIQGPAFSVEPKTAVSLSLGLHELATNAVKYGALSVPDGHIVLEWSVIDGGTFHLKWSEHGGPPIKVPERRGFGTRMIERGLATELGGRVTITFTDPGLVCEITSNSAVARLH